MRVDQVFEALLGCCVRKNGLCPVLTGKCGVVRSRV